MTIQTSVPDASSRTFSVTYDANGGTFGIGDDGNVITTNTVRYNAKNTMISGTYATPSKTGCEFAGWSTEKTGTSADFEPEENVSNTLLNSIADGGDKHVYALYKQPILEAGRAFNVAIKNIAKGGSGEDVNSSNKNIKSVQVTKTAPGS